MKARCYQPTGRLMRWSSISPRLKRGEFRYLSQVLGGAAHLGGVIAAKTQLPVLGVPMQSQSLQGLDSLLSIVQMPKGIPVGSLAIGSAGAVNAALLAAAILALADPALAKRLAAYREEQTRAVLADQL